MEPPYYASAVEALLASHRQALVAMIGRRIPRQLAAITSAEDLAQDVSLEAVRSVGDFRPREDDSLRRWVCRIARHRVCDLIKSQRRLKRAAQVTAGGGDDNDYLSCGTGNDTGRGGFGDDEIHGGDGNDYLYGDDGSDWLLGEGGDDCMFGGNGNDYFTAQDGVSEYIDGGAGWDTAFVDDRDWYEPWSANDTRYNVENAFE
jgi:RNA polymerase sigma factor (sigma-70 family)